MTDKEKIAETIRKFDYWNYNMEEIGNQIREYPEWQSWINALSERIVARLRSKY